MPTDVRISIIYYSLTGTVAEIAREMAETAEKEGAEVRLRKVPDAASATEKAAAPAGAAPAGDTVEVPVACVDDLLWADGVLLGSPTRFGNIAGPLKSFLDSLGGAWQKQQLADKVYSGFTATGSLHGGQESTLLALMTSFHHFGGVVVAPGYTSPEKFADGNPYGTAHCTEDRTRPVDDTTRTAARIQAARVVRFARAITAA
ncbi:NAD(P)H:quinone oxidoreductase [Streptomyces milbemycinicus]|uniref:NAD(P)H:quinone oxidoreductase n=1 Tax=Streptomyces milbemycinicus TaxID=476552 RepID=A0ABW8M2S6_9ACTN